MFDIYKASHHTFKMELKKEIRIKVSEENLNKIKDLARKNNVGIAPYCKMILFENINSNEVKS